MGAHTSKTRMLTARTLPMQDLMLFSQGMRCVHRIRLMTARKTCTADVCRRTGKRQRGALALIHGHT